MIADNVAQHVANGVDIDPEKLELDVRQCEVMGIIEELSGEDINDFYEEEEEDEEDETK